MFEVQDIDIDLLRDNPYDQRKKVGDIESLAESIKERGLQNPISVIKVEDYYIIVSGHRRTYAYRYLKRKEIPAIIRKESSPTDLRMDLAIENLQRKDLLPVEKGATIQQLFYTIPNVQNNPNRIYMLLGQVKWYGKNKSTGEGFTEEDIITAKRLLNLIGTSSTGANRYLRICRLPENIQANIISADNANNIPEGKIVTHVAYELSRLSDPTLQNEIFHKVVQNKMKHEDVKQIVDEIIEKNDILVRNKSSAKNIAKNIKEESIDTTKLTNDLFKMRLEMESFRSKIPLLTERFEKAQWMASLDQMKKVCLNMVLTINDMFKEDLKTEDLLEYVNADLEVNVKSDFRFNFPIKIAETLKIKDGDKLFLKVEGIERSIEPIIEDSENKDENKDENKIILR